MQDFPRWKVSSIIAFIVALMLLAVPSFIPESATTGLNDKLPRINFGLDLVGGSYLLLEADTKDVAVARLEQMRDTVLTEMKRANACCRSPMVPASLASVTGISKSSTASVSC